jgi:hypothetical protein
MPARDAHATLDLVDPHKTETKDEVTDMNSYVSEQFTQQRHSAFDREAAKQSLATVARTGGADRVTHASRLRGVLARTWSAVLSVRVSRTSKAPATVGRGVTP